MTNETQILKKTKQENSNFGKTIKEIWRGTADKWVFIPYLYGVLGIYFIGIIITASQYPNFHIYSDYISYLGSPKHSPAFIVYNTCMMIAGILLIPFYPFMYSHMKITKPEGQRNKAKVWEILLR